MKLIDLIYKYLEHSKYSIKERTLINYYQNATKYIDTVIGQYNIVEINSDILNEYLLTKYKEISKAGTQGISTLKITKAIINKSLEYGYDNGYIKQNLKITTNLKSNHFPKIECLTNNETRKIENDILENKRYYSFGILISMYTGLRIGELLALKWTNIDFENKIMNINSTVCDIAYNKKMYHIEDNPKSRKSCRQIPLTQETLSLLKTLKIYQNNNSDYVVSRATGKQIKIRAYQDSFGRLLKRLNIRHYGFHSLRHTFATRCYKNGMDIKTLSELLGHSSPSTTFNIYVHTDMDTKRNALTAITKKIGQKMSQHTYT